MHVKFLRRLFLIVLTVISATSSRSFGMDFSRYIFGPPQTLSINTQSLEPSTGAVIFNGADSQLPGTPFTWDWGDDTSSSGFFPQAHTYSDTTRNYVVECTAHYPDGSSDTVKATVYFTAPTVTPTELDQALAVSIARAATSLDTRLYPPPSLLYFDASHFGTVPQSTIEYVMSAAANLQYDFVNENVFEPGGKFNQLVLMDPGLSGVEMYSLWYANPVAIGASSQAMQGAIPYASFFHEMAHNFSLNTPRHYYFGGKIDGNANAIFSETMAQILQHSTAYEILNKATELGLSAELAADIESSAISAINVMRGFYDDYVSNGAVFESWNNPATLEDETLLTFMALSFTFVQNAEGIGQGYRTPMKRMMHFLQLFDPELHTAYEQAIDWAAADSFRATFMVAAMSYGFNYDFREEFAILNFPIDDTLFDELLSRTSLFGSGPEYAGTALLYRHESPEFPGSMSQPVIIDVNGDGKNDVVFSGLQDNFQVEAHINVLAVSEAGTLELITDELVEGEIPVSKAGFRHTVPGDFNGDGRTDLFLAAHGAEPDCGDGTSACWTGAQNSLLLSTVNGTLKNVTASHLPAFTDYSHGASALDYDGDGDLDIWVNSGGRLANSLYNPGFGYLLENNGAGVFSVIADLGWEDGIVGTNGILPVLNEGQYNVGSWSISLDVDNDGDTDLQLARSRAWLPEGGVHLNRLLVNDGAGSFDMFPGDSWPSTGCNASPDQPDPEACAEDSTPRTYQALVYDLNGDGLDDMLFHQTIDVAGEFVQILVSNGDGTFRDETTERHPNGPMSSRSTFQLHDLDGDGHKDLFSEVDFSKIDIRLNDGEGYFRELEEDWVDFSADNWVVLDVDGDGGTDFLIQNFQGYFLAKMKHPFGPNLTGTLKANRLIGGAMDNMFSGMAGNDILDGGLGDDQLDGGPGDDLLIGGKGEDTYIYSTADLGGNDSIIDTSGSNELLFLDFDLAQVVGASRGEGGDLILVFLAGGSITIRAQFLPGNNGVETLRTGEEVYHITNDPAFQTGSIEELLNFDEESLQVRIQELYVGILGRAADRPGLDYWADQINAGVFTLENTRAAFTDPAQSEYTEIYGGLNNTQLVTAIYENFLERAPELAGLLYWVGELDSGRVNADQMINAVINAVQDPNATSEESLRDLATLNNKIEAAKYFTSLTQNYSFDAAYREMARAVVGDVTDDPETLAQSKAMTDEYVD